MISLAFKIFTPSLSDKYVDFALTKPYYISFLKAFHVNFNHGVLKIISWSQLEGSQS